NQVHAQAASAGCTLERPLPEFDGFSQVPGLGLNDAQISRSVNQIGVRGQCPSIQLACLSSQAVLLLNVGQSGQKIGVIGECSYRGWQKTLGMGLGPFHPIVCQGLPSQGQV